MQWPARIPAGAVVDSPVTHLDIFTTAAAAAGAALPEDREIDGVDLLPHILGESPEPPHQSLFWREGHHQAVRHGDWKLTVGERETANGRETKRWLFNLATDPTEQQDLAAQLPDKVAELQSLLDDHNAAKRNPYGQASSTARS